MDLATHDLDIMRYLTGSEAIRAYAETRRELHPVHEDLFAGMLRFADGTLGTLEINWLTPTKIREIYVTGERGMYSVNYITQDLRFFENAETNGDDWAAMHLLRGVTEGSVIKLPSINENLSVPNWRHLLPRCKGAVRQLRMVVMATQQCRWLLHWRSRHPLG